MEINLVTHNEHKVKEFRSVLEPKVKVNHLYYDYPELRSDNPLDIVSIAARSLSERLEKTVVVEDSGFFIDALNGFPGTCTAYVHKRIGIKGFIKLMSNVKDRKCYYKSAIGYCEPGKDAVAFMGIEEGTVAKRAVGKKGWGQDPIFIPKRKKKTYGEIRKDGDVNKFRKDAISKLKNYLEHKKN
jgi:XTP/dITP diphosphohydrolase